MACLIKLYKARKKEFRLYNGGYVILLQATEGQFAFNVFSCWGEHVEICQQYPNQGKMCGRLWQSLVIPANLTTS